MKIKNIVVGFLLSMLVQGAGDVRAMMYGEPAYRLLKNDEEYIQNRSLTWEEWFAFWFAKSPETGELDEHEVEKAWKYFQGMNFTKHE